MILANLSLHDALYPIKFLLKKSHGLEEDVVRRDSGILFSAQTSLCGKIKASLFFHVVWSIPSSLCSREYMGLKKLFEGFQNGCLVFGHLWYLNGISLTILCLHDAWRLQLRFCLWGHMIWEMLFEEYQHGCLVFGHLWYLHGMI